MLRAFVAGGALLAALSCGQSTPSFPPPRVVDLTALQSVIESQRGGPVVVNFWAMWCPPCLAELPDLVAAQRAHPEIDLLTVSYDLMIPGVERNAVLAELAAFQRQQDLPYPILVYEAEDYDSINEALRLPGPIPVTLLLDAAGIEIGRLETAATRADFDALMSQSQSARVDEPPQ